MIRVTVDVDAPEYMAQGIKEQLAMELEWFGDAKVVSIAGLSPGMEQVGINLTGRNETW